MDKKREKGIIKWYSAEKGYGFITTDNRDIYFKKEVLIKSNDKLDEGKDEILPENGDQVVYKLIKTKKGQELAVKIEIEQRKKPIFICPYCKFEAQRRVIYGENEKKDQPLYSVCTNCYKKIVTFETKENELQKYNRVSALLLLLILITIIYSFI